jgi:glucose 1-dehydrogenase
MKDLSGKIALVTGGSRGIGAAIARDLAQAGAAIAINYHEDGANAALVQAGIVQAGGRAVAVAADIACSDAVDAMFDRVERELGPVDILVNNAGIETRTPSLEFTESDYDRILAVNLKGAFRASQRALRGMRDRGWGRVINISSVHERVPSGFCAPYSMSKAGLLMMTRELAVEFGPHGITVNSIAPGAIRTAMNEAVLANPAHEARVIARTPVRFIGEPSDVSRVVVFLASPAARFITGATLSVDGGLGL